MYSIKNEKWARQCNRGWHPGYWSWFQGIVQTSELDFAQPRVSLTAPNCDHFEQVSLTVLDFLDAIAKAKKLICKSVAKQEFVHFEAGSILKKNLTKESGSLTISWSE